MLSRSLCFGWRDEGTTLASEKICRSILISYAAPIYVHICDMHITDSSSSHRKSARSRQHARVNNRVFRKRRPIYDGRIRKALMGLWHRRGRGFRELRFAPLGVTTQTGKFSSIAPVDLRASRCSLGARRTENRYLAGVPFYSRCMTPRFLAELISVLSGSGRSIDISRQEQFRRPRTLYGDSVRIGNRENPDGAVFVHRF